MKKTILQGIYFLLIFAGLASAATHFVPGNYDTIQEAIDAAIDSDVVIVSPGTYSGDGNRDIDFRGKAITVRSTDPNDPNVVVSTIIDCQGTPTKQHRGFYFHLSEDNRSILAGFTIKNGNARCGGGVYCINSNPAIVSCIFTENTALQYEYIYPLSLIDNNGLISENNTDVRIMCPPPVPELKGNGGGICCVDSNAMIVSCTFIDNSAYEHGGGMYSMGGNPTLSDCLFIGNFAGGGGGMANLEGSSPILKNCTFNSNTAETGGGGMRNADNSNPTLTDCAFHNNSAGWSGGLGNYYSNPILIDCTFIGNYAENNGGGINNYESNPVFTNCVFSKNSAEVGGGIFSEYNSNSTLNKCTFSENTAHYGGGIYCVDSSPTMTDCTFRKNSAEYEYPIPPPSLENSDQILNDDNVVRVMCPPLPPSSSQVQGNGGGICYNHSRPLLINCTFSENLAFERGGAIYGETDSNSILTNCIFNANSAGSGGGIENYSSIIILTNCYFTDNSAVYGGGGMRSSFCNTNLTNCSFHNNRAGWSGGLGNYYSNSILNNCNFIGNRAETDGGGMNNSESNIVHTNCIFSGNSANRGGGIFDLYNSSSLINCTLIANLAGYGGAIYCNNGIVEPPPAVSLIPILDAVNYVYYESENANMNITNCILWYNEGQIGPQIYLAPYISVSYSNVERGWPGEGNIDAEPCFVDSGYWDANGVWIDGDYHLLPGSPCIDAGTDAGVYDDIDGNVRPFDFPGVDNNGDLPDFDMGAYEAVLTVQGRLIILPRTINYTGKSQKILAVMHLPEKVVKDDIDAYEKLVLYPGQIQAAVQRIVPLGAQAQSNVRIYAVFDRAEIFEALDSYGDVELTVIGRFITGDYFYGKDTVRIISGREGHRNLVKD